MRGLGAEPPAAGGQQGVGGETIDAATILQLFFTKYAFLGAFWSKFLLKTAFLNG